MSTLEAIKYCFKSHMIKQILHSWSFHMKFIKLAEGSLNAAVILTECILESKNTKQISYEMTTRVRSSIFVMETVQHFPTLVKIDITKTCPCNIQRFLKL